VAPVTVLYAAEAQVEHTAVPVALAPMTTASVSACARPGGGAVALSTVRKAFTLAAVPPVTLTAAARCGCSAHTLAATARSSGPYALYAACAPAFGAMA
jgi:hypothetical protein